MFRISPTVKNLIIINTVLLLGSWIMTSMYNYDLNDVLGLYFFKSEKFHYFQYITYMFMHGGFFHLLFNMYALFMFGTVLEQVWGSKKFLIFYLITGVGAALIHTLVNYIEYIPMINSAHAFMNTPSPELFSAFIKEYVNEPNKQIFDFINQWSESPKDTQYINDAIAMVNSHIQHVVDIPTVGASGAVFGILLGFGMLFPNTQLMLLFPPIPLKAKYFVMIYGGIEMYLAFKQPGSQIAHFAHLGGMLFGFILIKLWDKDRQNFY